MKIKDICGYKKEILSYCEKKTRYENMLIALDEDLSKSVKNTPTSALQVVG